MTLVVWHYHPEWGNRSQFDVITRLLAKNLKDERLIRVTPSSNRSRPS